jgi:hydroxymethylpyrimidine kinase/phosphomethylpyrimidine kinase/thiamine-phosphate diphosphorylase
VGPTILTIAGSDSSGGAGLQGDLKAIAANGGYGASVVTAITAQNTLGVTAIREVDPAMIRAQIEAVFADLEVAAVKTGMLASRTVIETVAEELASRRPAHLVCDPVMVAKSGARLLEESAVEALVERLLPHVDLVTPNVDEAAVLAGVRPRDREEAAEAGRRILERGPRAALVKGGHLAGEPGTDVLVTRDGTWAFEAPWIETPHTHGTGCTYSAAIATYLGRGLNLHDAVARAKTFLTEAIRAGGPVGGGVGPTDPFFVLRAGSSEVSPGGEAIGRLHVITDEEHQSRFSHLRLARLAAEGGADRVQYREKRPRPTREIVETARAIARALAGTRAGLIVDDRVDVAAAVDSAGVHLGADDLDPRVARRLLGERRLIGRTANGLDEALAAAREPVDYLGVGPVFGTRSKARPAAVLGLDELSRITAAVELPVLAIGNLTADRVGEVLAAGAHGVAVLSAVTCARDPLEATRRLREAVDASRGAVRR